MIRTRFGKQFTARALALACLLAIGQGSLATEAHGASDEANTQSGPGAAGSAMPDPTTAASNPLSDAGTSGYFLYRKHCRSCHGKLGEGTERGKGLIQTRYSKDHLSRQAFHEQFRHATRVHIKVARGTRNKPGPRFNDIELIGKFLREIEAWHAMLADASTE